eukprot:329602-Prymnesium_polylepis.1
MLCQYGLQQTTELSRFGSWARSEGAHVVQVAELSFQSSLTNSRLAAALHKRPNRFELLSGPYLRLDIPHIVREHNLFDLPCVCPEHALYTDTDVLFWNVSRTAIAALLDYMRTRSNNDAYIMYGRESDMDYREPKNTGVFFMSIPRFEADLPKLLAFGNRHSFMFDAYDQGWLNHYYSHFRRNRTMLPLMWNWKVYWPLPDPLPEPVRIVHFHGPKPGRGGYLDGLASGDEAFLRFLGNFTEYTARWGPTDLHTHRSYYSLVKKGMLQGDHGRFANITLRRYHSLLPSDGAICARGTEHQRFE